MKESTKESIKEHLEGLAAILFIIVAAVCATLWITYTVYPKDTNLTMHHSETLIDHDQRLIKIESQSWELKILNDRIDYLRKDLHESLEDLENRKASRLYNLEVTVCLFDEKANEVRKRKIVMNNIIALNPSVERTATVVDTWLGFWRSVEIPGILDSQEEYACDLKILSIK